MAKARILASVVALSALAAACSGGGSDQNADEKAAEAAPSSAAPDSATAPAEASGALAPDDVSTVDGTKLASFTGNAAAGKLVFAQCRTCHVTDPGVNKIGPSLAGIIGRKAGSVPGYNYSQANAGSGDVWTKEKLFQFLEKPQRVIPKTKMIFAGLPDAQKRADLIAYLENPT